MNPLLLLLVEQSDLAIIRMIYYAMTPSLAARPLRLLQPRREDWDLHLGTLNSSLTIRSAQPHGSVFEQCAVTPYSHRTPPTVCPLTQRVLADYLYRYEAAVSIQQRYRGCIVRSCLNSIHNASFDYQDCELDGILSDNIEDLIHFDEAENDLLDWSPQKPKFPEPAELKARSENEVCGTPRVAEPIPKTKRITEWRTMMQRRRYKKRGNGIALRSRR